MKIGVALSGCDIGGIGAFQVLQMLEEQGLDIGMISACCIPAVTSFLYAKGCEDDVMRKFSEGFLSDYRESNIGFALQKFFGNAIFAPKYKIPVAINAVNISDGKIVTFTDNYSNKLGNLKTFEIKDPRDALSAAISLMDGLESYRYEDLRLCDFCCWYGCPIHPLKMAGLKKNISVAFLPKYPKTPYEALVKRMITASSSSADIHIPIEFAGNNLTFDQYLETAENKIKSQIKKILFKTLF